MVASRPLVLSRRALYTVRNAAWITGGWIVAAVLVHWFVRRVPTHAARELTAAATGAVMGLGSAWFELRLVPRLIRGFTMGGLLLVRTFSYVILCAAAIHVVTMSLLGLSEHGGWLGYYTSEQYRDFVLGGRFLTALVLLTLTSFTINFVRQLDRMLGPGTLGSLLIGRYHRPVAEDRIFMFLDLNDSTAIAARLGPLRFNEFKNDFFHDIAAPILETHGRIYQYVGDEAVVTWTLERGLRQGNCLRCIFLVTEVIHERRDRYQARYGIVPAFKAGLHGGPVVTAEIGDIKKDIVHSGDTVNTAARVEAQCRPLERRVLVTEALLRRCPLPDELEAEDMGERELRGKAETVRLFSVRARRQTSG
jgi:adenylate cyclase